MSPADRLKIRHALESYMEAETEYRLAHGHHLNANDRLAKAVGAVNEATDALGKALAADEQYFQFGGAVVHVVRKGGKTYVNVVNLEPLS